MNDAHTEQKHTQAQGDLAPAALGKSLHAPDVVTAQAGDQALAVTPRVHRRKTWGERLFDLTTYGGFALGGNEITATAIVGAASAGTAMLDQPLRDLGLRDTVRAVLGKTYLWADRLTTRLNPGGRFQYMRSGTDPVTGAFRPSRLTYINFAIIGGMLMVPFIKILEDNKGRLVRAADMLIHGKRAETDPHMVLAHEEMDNAPKQSWGSLWKGRILTVAAAYTVDASIGWHDSWLSRALANTPLRRFRSFDHISNEAADLSTRGLRHIVGPERANQWNSTLRTGFGLLTLSAALTLLFYVSSKIFASRRDRKQERNEEADHERLPAETHGYTAPARNTPIRTDELDRAGPHATVHAIEPKARLAEPAMQEGLQA